MTENAVNEITMKCFLVMRKQLDLIILNFSDGEPMEY